MCGISGIITNNENKNKYVSYLNKKQIRRGPDNNDIYVDDNIALGHCRLAIQDVSNKANQPYIYKEFVMVYNGEIYNYKNLKEELITEKNEIFLTNSDTELLMKMFYYYEKEIVLNKLEGMFSISLYNKKKNTLTLIRDRFG